MKNERGLGVVLIERLPIQAWCGNRARLRRLRVVLFILIFEELTLEREVVTREDERNELMCKADLQGTVTGRVTVVSVAAKTITSAASWREDTQCSANFQREVTESHKKKTVTRRRERRVNNMIES